MESTIVYDQQTQWDTFRFYGASFGALQLVGKEFGYSVIAIVKICDVFFVRNDLLNTTQIPTNWTNADVSN